MTREEILAQAKPMIFNADMAEAIAQGRKTCTRRLVSLKDLLLMEPDTDGTAVGFENRYEGVTYPPHLWSRYSIGGYIYVRETWQYLGHGIADPPGYVYRGSEIGRIWEKTEGWKWKPAIHMPKDAARLFLKVTEIRVERLQNITWPEVEAEGTDLDAWYEYDEWQHQVGDGCVDDGIPVVFETLKGFFGHTVWDKTMKSVEQYEKYGWDANPWVWVYRFEPVEAEHAEN